MPARHLGDSERRIQAKVLKYLRRLEHAKFFKIIVANERGVPDIIGCYKGQFVAFEIKRPGEELNQLQWVQGNDIMIAGGEFHRIDTLQAAVEVIEKLKLERHGL